MMSSLSLLSIWWVIGWVITSCVYIHVNKKYDFIDMIIAFTFGGIIAVIIILFNVGGAVFLLTRNILIGVPKVLQKLFMFINRFFCWVFRIKS